MKYINTIFSIFFGVKGRLSRKNFFLIYLVYCAVMVLAALGYAVSLHYGYEYPLVILLFYALFVISQLCVSIRRLHDMNKSGYLVLLYNIIYPFSILLLGLPKGDSGDNKYGKKTK